MKDGKIINGNCWVAYFDLLGFKNRTREFKGHLDILRSKYKEIIKKVKESNALQPDKVSIHWFSDSFFFYCSDDSYGANTCIDLEIRFFFKWAIWMKWPLRGALTVGELYAEKKENIYLGQAIIDAHEYTEKQNWIGLIITPEARNRLKEICPKFAQTNDVYTDYNVPIKSDKSEKEETEKLLAFRFAHFPSTDSMILKRMEEECQRQQDDPAIKKKYENTIKFIKDTQ